MKAVIYARYSCDNQREESIDGQLRECKEFAERKVSKQELNCYNKSRVDKHPKS